jgi:NAD(P)-dependent dehydrogenase (short-subunit alcohol dehydrogenase family)
MKFPILVLGYALVRHEPAGERAAQEIGAKASFVRADITSDADIAALVAKTVECHGQLDFLVNVACTYLDNGADTTRSDWLKAFDVNIVGSVMLMQGKRPTRTVSRGRNSRAGAHRYFYSANQRRCAPASA